MHLSRYIGGSSQSMGRLSVSLSRRVGVFVVVTIIAQSLQPASTTVRTIQKNKSEARRTSPSLLRQSFSICLSVKL